MSACSRYRNPEVTRRTNQTDARLMNTLQLNANRWIAEEPEVAAGVLTVAVHVGFAAMLLLNINWQHRVQPNASVKLWESLPTNTVKSARPRKTKPTPPPAEVEPSPAPAPEPVTVQAELVPTPAAQLDAPPPAAAPPPPRADLAAPSRDMIDQPPPEPVNTVSVDPPPTMSPTPFEEQPAPQPEVNVEELKRQRALELAQLLRDEESARLEDTLEQEREARSAELKKRLDERERKLAQELGEIRTATEQRRQDEQAQAQMDAAARALTDDYRARISAKIRQRVILPPDLQGNPEAIYAVSLLPGGTVTEVRLLKTSGVSTYDAAVERAILAAQPLPVPEEPGLFQANFKNLRLNFRPKE